MLIIIIIVIKEKYFKKGEMCMAEKIIRTIIQLRRDTEANWQVSEYVAKAGEPMVTLDGEHKGHIKMGDGESLWSALPYITDGSGQPVTVQVDGTSIVEYPSISRAAKETGLSTCSIQRWCNRQVKGWSYGQE